VDDVLDADRDPAQRALLLRTRIGGTVRKRANGLLLRVDRRQRLRERGVRRELALVDAALEVGERDHGRFPLCRHARPCAGHPRLLVDMRSKTWMAGTMLLKTRSALSPGQDEVQHPFPTRSG